MSIRRAGLLAPRLFAVFVLAKIAILWGRALPHSPWAPLAYSWQDAAVVFAFLIVERTVRRAWLARSMYGALVLLAVVNVPVARVLSSSLTMPMVRAARGTLGDSIRYHATTRHLAWGAAVLAAGVVLPLVWPAPTRWWRIWAAATFAIALAGGLANSRVDTGGLERHPLVALVRTSVPRVRAEPLQADWRASPFAAAAGASEDLSRLSGAARGQNVLLVVLESTAARYLRPYGAPEDPAPTLTALSAHAIVFENAYAVYPESIKGLAAILASRYPGFDVPAERLAAVMSPSLATRLAAADYDTALFHSGRFMYLGMDTVLSRSGFAHLEDAGDIGGAHNSSFGVDEPAAVRRILQWIDARPSGRRFFVAYLPIAGHHPYPHAAPGPFSEDAEIGRYRNAIDEGDRALGELVGGLRARGLGRSTVVVIIADHGEAFEQHAGNYGHTQALFDENVRVPLVMAVPGVTASAVRVKRTASLLDVAPTVLDLLGVAPPAAFEGESLLAGRARMALFFSDYSLGLLGLRDGCVKYIYALESARSKLFDLCSDPDERVDLAPAASDRTARYRDRLRRWSAAEVARIER